MSHEHAIRRCAQCSKVIPDDADRRLLYCNKVCKQAFHNINMKRGKEALAYLQVQRQLSHAKTPEEKALASYAWAEACHLIRGYNEADKASGRNPKVIIESRYLAGEQIGDRKKRRTSAELQAAALAAAA